MASLHERIAAARQRLRDAGIPPDEAGLDARLLAQHVLGWDAAAILTADAGASLPGFADRYDALVTRRARREPLAYITGQREFWNLPFEVTPDVLIPRPETELLVESLFEHFPDRDGVLRVADVCTGSGCVAVALAHERPRALVVATDISTAALAVAQRNAARLGVSERVSCLQADLLAGISGPFDVVVSNPPYIADSEEAALQPEVRAFEPAIALFGGPDGLAIVRRLVDQAVDRLCPGGMLMFEFGAGQESAVRELISSHQPLTMIAMKRDLAGISRVAVAQRR